MSVGFDFQTREGVRVKEVGVENVGGVFFSIVRIVESGEFTRMPRAYLLDIPKETVAPTITRTQEQGIQLGFL